MIDEYDVTIAEADLQTSMMFGLPVIALVFLLHELCFTDDRIVGKLFSRISNVHPKARWRRTELRNALGMVVSEQPFTDKELRTMIGRRLRVGVEEIEFQGRLHLRVVDFLRYSGTVTNPNYSDNEYVFMIRELSRETK